MAKQSTQINGEILKKPRLAIIAGVLWCGWAIFEFGSAMRAIDEFGVGAQNFLQMSIKLTPEITSQLTVLTLFRVTLTVSSGLFYLYAGLHCLRNTARNLSMYGWITLALVVGYFAFSLFAGSIVISMYKLKAVALGSGASIEAAFKEKNVLVYLIWLRWASLMTVGAVLAGIFAISANDKYVIWRQSRNLQKS